MPSTAEHRNPESGVEHAEPSQGDAPLALLLDLDGVIYQGDCLVDGARETMEWVDEQNIPHCFLTNTTSRPRTAIVEKLNDMGISVRPEDIVTPPVAAAKWLSERGLEPLALFVPDATRKEFNSLECLDQDAETGAKAVVLGDIGDRWTFSELNRAFRLLMAEPAPVLIALGMTRYWKTAGGLQLDVAPFVRALECAAGCQATVLGKPSAEFFHSALAMIGSQPKTTLMVGDDVVGDVVAAQQAGISGALVKTGKFQHRDLNHQPPPDVVLESIADLPQWWHSRGQTASNDVNQSGL